MPRQPKGGHHLWPHPSLQHTQCTVLAVARAGHQLHWRHPSKLQVGGGRRAARGRACLCTHSGSCPVPSLPLPVSTSGCTSRAWCKERCGVVCGGGEGRRNTAWSFQFCLSLHECVCACMCTSYLCAPGRLSHGDARDGPSVEHTVTHLPECGQARPSSVI